MNATKITIASIFFLFSGMINAQIGLGTSNPDASAVLDLSSISKGFLVPRMDNANKIAISNPALGLIIFNTDSNKLEINNESLIPNWVEFSAAGPVGITGIKGAVGPQGLNGFTYSGSGVLGSIVGGGTTNSACGLYSTVIGGTTNESCGLNSTVGGGTTNNASATNSAIAGGTTNLAAGTNSFVGGGTTNFSKELNSSVSGGTTNQALGFSSAVSGGSTNIAAAENAAVGGGDNNHAMALNSNVSAGTQNRANGVASSVSGGRYNFAQSYGEWAGGLHGTTYLAASVSEFKPTDRIFNLGNGVLPPTPADAFSILKNGLASLPSSTVLLIKTADNKAIMTKEYSDATYSKINTNAPLAPGDFGIVGEIRVTDAYVYSCIAPNTWVRTAVETF